MISGISGVGASVYTAWSSMQRQRPSAMETAQQRPAAAEDARQAGHPLSEVSIRRIIQTLCRNQLAFQGRGRVGSRITTLGIAAFELFQKNSWLQRALRNLDS